MPNLWPVPPHQVLGEWPAIRQLITDACDYNHNRYAAQDYLTALLKGQKQLWLVRDERLRAVVITEVIQFPQKKCASIDICTGAGVNEWIHLISELERWAASIGCKQMLLAARPGMERKVKNYKKTHVILEKEL